ncbi:darcynin family protein [Emticicia sp. C21]|uniref:darcynin family protein n=1 Tax=Emticicia sp. C21 TaxID=2302915 RepID=UPI000E3574AA|nr:darcynin family protein [Emticicia sp. C21]RFS14992.1 hypothetical protein D0T08_18090 [Emticicia sp. C21]
MTKIIFTFFIVLLLVIGKAQSRIDMMETKKPYTILVLMNATPQWLSLTRNQRSQFFEKQVMPIFQKVGQAVEVKLFDSEYFHAKVSDFMIISTENLNQYKLLIELLRDSKIYGVPYFEIVDIIVGQENLFADFNEVLRKEKND